jgi:hypothetical protein
MKILYVKQMGLAVLLSLAVFSCSKDEKSPEPTATDNASIVELTSQKVITDAFFDDVSAEVLLANTDNGLTAQAQTQQEVCATITISPKDPAVWPKTVTLDYGTAGCTGLNGNLRKGKVIYTIDKKLLNTGAKISVSFDNYTVNGYKLEGVLTITNNGSLNGLNVTATLTNGKVTYPDGKWFTRTSTTNWVQTAGLLSLSLLDDEYNLTGSGAITSSDGNVLTAASKTNLLRKASCLNIVSGQLDLTFNNVTGVLDFGNGDCDKKAVITIAGKQYEVTMP